MNRVGLALLLLAGCGPRALELDVVIASDCTFSVPGGGSVFYEVEVGTVDGGAPRVCGGCLTSSAAVGDPNGLIALLRQSAPRCTLSPGETLRVRLSSFSDAACTIAPSSSRLCGSSAPIVAGGGTSDQRSMATVSCAAGCNGVCTPISCADQGKDCDSLGDGCGTTLSCGICRPPLRCGGGGTPNVCGK
jgi:hypothetical protein